MGTFGLSSEVADDHRIADAGPSAMWLWVSSVAWTSRTTRARASTTIRLDDLADLGDNIDPADVDRLVAVGLWAGDETLGWSVVENGLWTLDPDHEPDVLGDGPNAFRLDEA